MAPGRKSSQKRLQEARAARKKAAEDCAAQEAAAAAAADADAAAAADADAAAAADADAAAAAITEELATWAAEGVGQGAVARVAATTRAAPLVEMDAAPAEMAAPSRALPLVPIPSLPETGDSQPSSSSRGADASRGAADNAVDATVPLLSIRTSKKKPVIMDMDTRKEPKPGKRNIVTGTKTQFMKRANDSQPIVVKYDARHGGPATKEHRSMMSRDIGSAVRSKIPMKTHNFLLLESEDKQPFEDYLKSLYHLPPTEFDLWRYIDRTAARIFREWKHECKDHYTDVSKATPAEFIHRPEEWEWLKSQFEDPEYKKLCVNNANNRNKKKEAGTAINHYSGTTPYSYRVAENLEKGSLAPLLQMVCDVYGPSQNAQPIVAAVKRKMDEMVTTRSLEAGQNDVTSPIPIEDQMAVIEKEMADGKPGTSHRGLRNAAKRPAKQRGGARVSRESVHVASMQEKLNDVKQEMVDLKAQMSRILAAQANANASADVVVVASPNLPSKSSQAGNHDLDYENENENDL